MTDFAESTATDRHFVLDALRRRGRLRPAGAAGRRRHRATRRGARAGCGDPHPGYAIGGGTVGNVAAGTINTLRSSIPFVAAVSNAVGARGGTDAETLDQARDRGALALRTRRRAVTAEDYEALAREAAPEAARIRCVTAGEAGLPSATVEVLVVPAAPTDGGRVRLADLVPTDELLARLAEHLDTVRLIGTTVLVEPPRYRGVTVVARLVARRRLEPGCGAGGRAAGAVRLPQPAARRRAGGARAGRSAAPSGSGEIHALLQRVAGVETVEDVRLFSANPVTGERGGETSRVELDANSVVFSFDHHVRVEAN